MVAGPGDTTNSGVLTQQYIYQQLAAKLGIKQYSVNFARSSGAWQDTGSATFDAAGQGPDHRHVTWNAAPPTLEIGTTLTFDDYGNVTDTLTKTTGGRKTEEGGAA